MLSVASVRGAASEIQDRSCVSSGVLGFVCGVDKPEDLARIPDTHWLITSGFSEGAGLKLIDMQAKTMRFWYLGRPEQIAPQADLNCGAAPQPDVFKTRGISLRRMGPGLYRLLVVSHKVQAMGREAIEIFDVDARRKVPALIWKGCHLMPDGQVANSVASFSDGTILTTVLTRPGTSITDFVEGRDTGDVYEWRPGDSVFHRLPGTNLPGNNGLEASKDDRFFYVVAFGRHSVVVYNRADTKRPVKEVAAPGFMPDNIHWDGGRLIAAGMHLDEVACGGKRKIINGVADSMLCHRGFKVAVFDPEKGVFSTLYDTGPDADFSGVSAAVIDDKEVWLGSFQADRLAWAHLAH